MITAEFRFAGCPLQATPQPRLLAFRSVTSIGYPPNCAEPLPLERIVSILC